MYSGLLLLAIVIIMILRPNVDVQSLRTRTLTGSASCIRNTVPNRFGPTCRMLTVILMNTISPWDYQSNKQTETWAWILWIGLENTQEMHRVDPCAKPHATDLGPEFRLGHFLLKVPDKHPFPVCWNLKKACIHVCSPSSEYPACQGQYYENSGSTLNKNEVV